MLALLALLAPAAVALQGSILPDPELDAVRGGFRLPNGIDVALAVQTQTALNGNIVLRSVFTVDQGPATFTVQAPVAGQSVFMPQSSRAAGAENANAVVTYDGRNGIQITPAASASAVRIGSWNQAAASEGLTDVASGTVTDNGTVSVGSTGNLHTAQLDAADISVTHFAGNAFGSLIANMGNDRSIDTTTTLSIDLRGAGPDNLGSAGFRVENVALDALRLRGGL